MPSSARVDVRRRKAANFLAGLFSVEVVVVAAQLRVLTVEVAGAVYGTGGADFRLRPPSRFIRLFMLPAPFVVVVSIRSRRLALGLVVLSLPVEPRQL